MSLYCLTLRQPWASLVALGPKWIETRGWQPRQVRPPFRIGIHAGKTIDHHALTRWRDDGTLSQGVKVSTGALVASATVVDVCPIGGPTSFRTGTFEGDEGDFPGQAVIVAHPDYGHDGPSLVIDSPDAGANDISGQLPLGDFTPGRSAWLLYDRKPTTERCPWCWGARKLLGGVPGVPFEVCQKYGPCPVCWPRSADGKLAFWDDGTAGRCDPIPMPGALGLWKWTPNEEIDDDPAR